jgi:hypothetical protein
MSQTNDLIQDRTLIKGRRNEPHKSLRHPDGSSGHPLEAPGRRGGATAIAIALADEVTEADLMVARVAVVFETGRDCFWPVRWLKARHMKAYVIRCGERRCLAIAQSLRKQALWFRSSPTTKCVTELPAKITEES